MRPIGIGLAAALILAVVTPAALMATAAQAAKAPAPAITKEARAKGMTDAPGLITGAGLDCQLADARFIGVSDDAKTHTKTSFYEVACTGSEGIIVAEKTAKEGKTFDYLSCMETADPGPDGKPNSLTCMLPGNADPKAGLAPFIAKSGAPCAVAKARGLGHNPDVGVFELACQDGSGLILRTSSPPRLDKPVVAEPCAMYEPTGNISCKLTDRTAQLAVVDRLIQKSGKPCVVKDRRWVGVSVSKNYLYEVACQDGKGYMLVATPQGALSTTISCASSPDCKLTDSRQAQSEQAGLYTRLAQKAGFNCDVKTYAPFAISLPGKEAVELVCNNRPDGAVGVFAAASSVPSVVYDCAHSELYRFHCTMTKPETAYPKLTEDLKVLNKGSCSVSNARYVGTTADKRAFMEVACADGLQGYMIEYTTEPALSAKQVIVCSAASGVAGGCSLPGNTKH
jgi:hypothetical protein